VPLFTEPECSGQYRFVPATSVKNRELRTVKQATAERPYLTERWLRRLIYDRRLPHYKVAGKVLVDLIEVDALVEAGRREAV
jgi:hypothetical protein